jgi:hypothetical protein
MSEVICRLAELRPDISLTIVGPTLDDIGLMRRTHAFVTGAVNAEEFGRVVNSLGLERLFVASTQPLFGHPIQSAAFSSPLPIAYFDWSRGRVRWKKADLPISPDLSFPNFIDVLNRWIPAP